MEPLTGPVPALPVRVFLLIQNRLLREALVRLFRRRTDLNVVGERSPSDISPLDLLESSCTVLVLDAFPPVGCLGFLEEKGTQAFLKTIFIGMEPDERQFMATVRFGAMGYLLKDASAADVVAAVRAVSRGEAICPPVLCPMLFRLAAQATLERPLDGPPGRPDLTLRQQQLVSLVAKGLTNKEIACHLNLSAFTVRNHIHRILKQVDAESRSEAVENIRSFGYSISS